MEIKFDRLSIEGWRQFEKIDISFHQKLTVLTGANGAGKTTLLNLLNRHFGWNLQFVSTPRKQKKGVLKYLTDIWEGRLWPSQQQTPKGHEIIGEIEYSNETKATIDVPEKVVESYNVTIRGQQQVPGVFVSSHRPAYVYQKLQQIPTILDAKDQIFNKYLNDLRARYNINARVTSPSFRIKEALVSLATFGYGNEVVSRDDEAIKTFEGYQSVLRIVLPKSLGFNKFIIRMPEVLLDTDTGEFSFDAVSGGVASLLDLSWQIYMSSLLNSSFVVVIDEPENHLHPALQRSLLPDLIKAFPTVQFVVATHNPFMVTSVPDSNVYVLNYNNVRKVESGLLDIVNKAGSSNEVLRDVLGVSNTLPIWAQDKVNSIIEKYSGIGISENSIKGLRKEMSELGLEHLFPEAITTIVGN